MICLVGMPGSGKGEFVKIARRFSFSVISMGDVVREETLKRGFPLKEHGKVAKLLREEIGEDAVARLTCEKIDEDYKIVDGVRSLAEIRCFKKHFQFSVLAIHASQKTRFLRLKKRGRKGDPKNFKDFERRDQRELKFGLGEVIALADFMLVNEDSLDKFKRECKRFLEDFVQDRIKTR
ncbi:MAG: AAA family ATPase [Candidatus Methanofastidiosia archaeon]